MHRIALSVLLMTFAVAPALADGVYKDRERLEQPSVTVKRAVPDCPGRPVTLTNRSSNYVGSEMGLGKPSYYGTPRPDPHW